MSLLPLPTYCVGEAEHQVKVRYPNGECRLEHLSLDGYYTDSLRDWMFLPGSGIHTLTHLYHNRTNKPVKINRTSIDAQHVVVTHRKQIVPPAEWGLLEGISESTPEESFAVLLALNGFGPEQGPLDALAICREVEQRKATTPKAEKVK